MTCDLVHVAIVAIVGVLGGRLLAVIGEFFRRQEAGFVRLVVIGAKHQARLHALCVVGIEPLACQRILARLVVLAIPVGCLHANEVVLGEVVRFVAERQLTFARVEAAVRQPAVQVVAALARGEVDVAADVVQTVSRIVGAAHHFDVGDVQRKHHVDEALIAAVDVAGDSVDQRLDAIDVALAVERAERRLPRLGALARLGQLDARHLPKQLPAVHDILVLDLIAAHHVDRRQHAVGQQRAVGVPRFHLAQRDRGVSCLHLRVSIGRREHGQGHWNHSLHSFCLFRVP